MARKYAYRGTGLTVLALTFATLGTSGASIDDDDDDDNDDDDDDDDDDDALFIQAV